MTPSGVFQARCEDRDLAAAAAHWVVACHPDIIADTEAEFVTLTAEGRGVEDLSLIWNCALANERLLIANEPQRTALMAALLQ